MGTRVRHWALRAALGCVAGALAVGAGLAGVGMLAGAGYLALRTAHSASFAAAVVGAVLLVLCGLVLALLGVSTRRIAARGGQRRAGAAPDDPRIPPELGWIARDPLAASALALLLGVGAGRSSELRRILRVMLQEWLAVRR